MSTSTSNPGNKIEVTAGRISDGVRWRALYNPSVDTNVTVNITSGPDTYSEDIQPKQTVVVTCVVNTTSATLHGYVDETRGS
jgi:hypothetical protein